MLQSNVRGHPATLTIWVMLFGFGLAGCGGPRFVTDDVDTAYQAAIRDAEEAEPSEIATRLTPITASNEALVWRGTPGQSLLLVVTWTDTNPLDAAADDTLVIDEDIWVTVVPEVRDHCRSLDLDGETLALRLQQLLGLPPDTPYDRFVELWVNPGDLFRPCPDPEITDRECERNFPEPAPLIRVSDDHKRWFRTMRGTMYGPDGYPWTRLGYTYDWGDPETDFGFSEFVIRPDATVEVQTVAPTSVYCQ